MCVCVCVCVFQWQAGDEISWESVCSPYMKSATEQVQGQPGLHETGVGEAGEKERDSVIKAWATFSPWGTVCGPLEQPQTTLGPEMCTQGIDFHFYFIFAFYITFCLFFQSCFHV